MNFLMLLIENWVVILGTLTSICTGASAIARFTGNETASKTVYRLQKVIDTLAMSSTPTKLKG